MKIKLKPIAAAVALSLAASPAWALTDFYLAAKAYNKTMPDGTIVPMWGFVDDPGGACYDSSPATRQACIDALPAPDPSFSGQRLVIDPAEPDIRIRLSNGLPEPTSVVIPGQKMPVDNAGATGPTWNDGTTGPRTSASQRVRSFGVETPPNGGRSTYVWRESLGNPIDHPGTMMYHSGTHPQKQVYMGLAGLVTKDAAAGEAYPGVTYDNDVTLFYSDIDPAFNEAVAAGTLSTAMGRHPSWFLVNGQPYATGLVGDITNGTQGPLSAGNKTLLRLASTASDAHVVVMQGMDLTLHAEDGQQYNWQDIATGITTPAPRKQYSALLPPAKTKDAIIVAPANGRYAVYDGDGYMTNPSDPENETVGDSVGGMLRFLNFGTGVNDAPTAVDDAAAAVAGLTTVISPLGNDSDPEGDNLSIASFDTTGTLGVVSCATGVTAGTCSYDASALSAGTVDSFTYVASDGVNNSASATVTVTVGVNQPPVALDDAGVTDEGIALVIGVTANDSDPEGQALTVDTFDAVSTGGQTVACAGGSCTYTPTSGFSGGDSFTYTVSDGISSSAPATVSLTVNPAVPPNNVPTAVDDASTTSTNSQVTIDVVANDTDLDGDTLSFATPVGTGSANTEFPVGSGIYGTVACVDATGACTYTPPAGFAGIDTFTYSVTDGQDTSNVATVTVDVTGSGAVSMYFSTSGAGAVPGVSGPYDDADVYTADGANVFARLYDAVSDLGLPNNANIDGISINGTTIYVSFAGASTNVPGLGGIPDEDVVAYDTGTGTWSTYFTGSTCGLNANNAGDIDAISVSGGTLYFSTVGNVAVTGVGGTQFDDADVYTWSGGASCGRALNAAGAGDDIELPGNANIDGLTVVGNTYYMSFQRSAGTSVPTLGIVQDEAVVSYTGTGGPGTWSLIFSGTGLLDGANSQNVDALHYQP